MSKNKTPSTLKENCNMTWDLWLDYSEHELDSELAKDLEIHRASCSHCQKQSGELEVMNRLLERRSDRKMALDLKLPDDQAFKKMHLNIMDAVEKTHIENVVPLKRAELKVVFAASAAVFVLVFGTVFVPSAIKFKNQTSKLEPMKGQAAQDQLMVESAHNDLEAFGDVIISHEGSDDLLLDAAAEKLSHMTDKEASSRLEELK